MSMTKLACPIPVTDLEQALGAAGQARRQGADLVEFRVDEFADDPSAVAALVERAELPAILTCRPTWEGGAYAGDEDHRLRVFEAACGAARPPAYVDVELEAWRRLPMVRKRLAPLLGRADAGGEHGPGLILSSHDFERRPADLFQKLEAMIDEPLCRVIKLAWQARSLRDNLEALELIRQQYKPTIALCMGEFGLASRLLARKCHALLSFAALEERTGTAPGQPTLEEARSLYRWDRLQRRTRVFGVIGWPVGHSRSPAIHNAGFEHAGVDAVYLPMPIPPEYEHFKATVGSWLDASWLDFGGASVTIPHKENLLRFVRERGGRIEPLAEMIGAANTLVREADGSLLALNTDYPAALEAVCDGLSIGREELAGRRIAVIGAGGAARAIVAGFARYGAEVVIYNRTFERAEALAVSITEKLGALGGVGAEAGGGRPGRVTAARLDELAESPCDVFINCTPQGMHPEVEGSPVEDAALMKAWGPGAVVFDTIYNPPRTRLLAQAAAMGCHTIGGVEMFVRQAAGQFQAWTGQAASLETFRKVMKPTD